MQAQYKVNEDTQGLLQHIRCFALDMDGTVYLDEEWIDGAPEFLRRIEETGRQYVFLTNNSSKNAGVYLEKLARMGLEIPAERLVTSGGATVDYLQKNYPGKRVYLLGNHMLRQEFSEAGIELDEESPDLVVTSFDTELTYHKMTLVCDFVRQGLPFIATHPDYNCPTKTGFIPDIGAIHAFIQASTGRMPDVVVGKPNKPIVDYMLARTGCRPEETALVGDRLYTDIAAGVNNGLNGVFVLSGEATLADLPSSPAQPHLIFDSVKQITPLL